MLSNVIKRIIVCRRVESFEDAFLLTRRCCNELLSYSQNFSIFGTITSSRHFSNNALLHSRKECFNIPLKKFHTSLPRNGRYGHRLVKLWEQKEYTTKPIKVYKTGGRMPLENWKGQIVPGRVWTSKLGGGLDREFHWVQRQRLTAEEVKNEVMYQEKVIKIIEDDNRSGHIALVAGPWKRRWILATQNMKVGDLLTNSARVLAGGMAFNDGDAYPLKLIPIGTMVCFLEFFPGKGGQIARSAGSYCILTKKTETHAVLTMPSKREIHVDLNCVAVIGAVSKPGHKDEHWGNVQTRRNYGLRPRSGRCHMKDGRFRHSGLPTLPPVVISEKIVLQLNTDFEE